MQATLIFFIVIENKQINMAQWEALKTDGDASCGYRKILALSMGMLHRETEQINALQQRVQVLEEEIEKLIDFLPLRDVP